MMRSMEREGKARRDKAVSMAMKRKEEYLGARVPKELRDHVIRRAKEMGIPVSILIRNILEESFKDSVQMSAPGAENQSNKDKFSTVLGWEKIELNKDVLCYGCNSNLSLGKKVYLGLGAAEPVVLCNTCKDKI